MLITSRANLARPDGPLLSRVGNFAALRDLLTHSDPHLAHETLLLGNDYARVEMQPGFARGYVEFIAVAENFFVTIQQLDFARNCAFHYPGENWIRFNFNLSGTASVLFDGRDGASIEQQTAHLMLHPEGVIHSDHYFHGSSGRWVSILCRKEHLTDIMGFDPEAFPRELRRFLADGEPSLYMAKRPISLAMLKCVNDFFRPTSTTALRPLFIKAKAYEAVYAFLEDCANDTRRSNSDSIPLSRRDIDRLHEARSLIESDPAGEIALAQLARRVGLNRSKLSQGFHRTFGVTILEFARVHRLNAAFELLRDTDLPVSQIAERCGYVHLSSFSAAFKNQFGISATNCRMTAAAPARQRPKRMIRS